MALRREFPGTLIDGNEKHDRVVWVMIIVLVATFDALLSPSHLLGESRLSDSNGNLAIPKRAPFVFEHRQIGAYNFFGLKPSLRVGSCFRAEHDDTTTTYFCNEGLHRGKLSSSG